MREGAKEVWARARFDFLDSDGDQDDAAAFVFAALDADRRSVPVLRSDISLVDHAFRILKLDRPLPPQRKVPLAYGEEVADPNRSRGMPPVESNSRLKQIAGEPQFVEDPNTKEVRAERGSHVLSYEEASEKDKRRYLQQMASGRITHGDSRGEENYHHDSHAMEALDIFRPHSQISPMLSAHNMLLDALYLEGGAKRFTDGERQIENAFPNHPHNSPLNLGKYTGEITLQSLHERALKRWQADYRNRYGRDSDNPEREFLNWKKFELAGYHPEDFFDEDGKLRSGDEIKDLLTTADESRWTSGEPTSMGHEGHIWGTEMLSPEERLNVMQWLAEGKPQDAKHIFDANGMGRDSDWIPFLNRQGLARLSRFVQKTSASSIGPAIINRKPKMSGSLPNTSVADISPAALERALQKIWVDEDGAFSHYGKADNPEQMSAHDFIRKRAIDMGLYDLDGGRNEHLYERFGLPDITPAGVPFFNLNDEGRHITGGREFSSKHLDAYMKSGLLPTFEDDMEKNIYAQLFGTTDANGGNPFAQRADHHAKAGDLLRDVINLYTHALDPNGNPSFTSDLDIMHAGSGGLGLETQAFIWAQDEMLPGLYTRPPTEFTPERMVGSEDMGQEAYEDAFYHFQGDDDLASLLGREIHPNHRGVHSLMEHGVEDDTEQQSHIRLRHTHNDTPNDVSINGELGMKDPRLLAGLTSRNNFASLPQKYQLLLALAQGARRLDEGAEGEEPHWIIPMESLAENLSNHDWWESRGRVPFTERDANTGRLNENQLSSMMAQMGTVPMSENYGMEGSEPYRGLFNVYNTQQTTEPNQFSGSWDDYGKAFEATPDLTQPIPIFDPRDFVLSDPNGIHMSDVGREDVARFIMQNAHGSLLGGVPREPPTFSPTTPPTFGRDMSDEMGEEEMEGGLEAGRYIRHAQEQGVFGSTTSDQLRPDIIPMWYDEMSTHPENASFMTEDGQRVAITPSNPADLARNYLNALVRQHDLHTQSGRAYDLKHLEDAIKQQREVVRQLDDLHYPTGRRGNVYADAGYGRELVSSDDTGTVPIRSQGAGLYRQKRMLEPIQNMNDTHNFIAQMAPAFVKLINKLDPEGRHFEPDMDAETGEENWNRAYVNALALLPLVERYGLGHMTPEMNKRIAKETGVELPERFISMSERPTPAHTMEPPRDQEIHDSITDMVNGGHDNMLSMLHKFVTDGVQGTDLEWRKNQPPTLAGTEAPDPRKDYLQHTEDILTHAVARTKAIRDKPELAKYEHERIGYGARKGKADRVSPNGQRWRDYVNEVAADTTRQEVAKIIKDNPQAVLRSLSARHNYSPFEVDEKGAQIGGMGGIASNSRVHKLRADEESKHFDMALKHLTHTLRHTHWMSEPTKTGRPTYQQTGINETTGQPMFELRPLPKGSKEGVYSGQRQSGRGAHDYIQRHVDVLGQPLAQRKAERQEDSRVPLHRMSDGKHGLQPHYTAPVMVRHSGHRLSPTIGGLFRHNGTPEIITDRPSSGMFLNGPLSLLQHIVPGLQPMHARGTAAMQSLQEHVIMGTRGESFDSWSSPYYAKTMDYLQHLFGNRYLKGEPMEWLTFLKADEREKGDASPIKAAHRIFDLSDIEHLRGFSGSWVVSAWPEGQRIRITREDDKVTTTGASLPDALKEEVKKINKKNFIIDAIYDGQHLHIVDLLKISGEDVTDEHMKDRIRALRSTFEATEKIKTPQPVNTRQTDDKGLKDAVDEIESERVMLRDADSTYMDGEARHPKWVLLDNEKRVAVIILGERGTTRTVYRLGIGPISDEEGEALGNRAHKLNGKYYMDVGTADGDGSFEEGDHATVTVGSVTRRERDGHTVFSLNGAKLQSRAESNATDSTETLGLLTKSGVPQIPHTVSVQGTNIIVSIPSVEDDVIYKAHRLENETGVLMNTWRIGRGESMKGDFSIRLAETVRPCWEPLAALMLKGVAKLDYNPRPERDKKKKEVLIDPRPEKKKPKRMDRNQILKDPVVVKALNLLDALLTKEKMTWTGPKGLAIGLGSEDSAPRGPTELTRPSTLPDFYPTEDDPEKPAKKPRKGGKTTTVTTDEGEKAALRVSEDGAMLELQSD